MHEIRVTVPPEVVDELLRITRAVGIEEATTREVYVHGINAKRVVFSVETSTPRARALTEALSDSSVLTNLGLKFTSRELRAIVGGVSIQEVTKPMTEPFADVVQDLWQLSHLTWSYVGRALAGAILLADGIIEDNPIAIVVAALFLPFLSQVLAMGVGIWSRDAKLAFHGAKAVGTSIVLGVLGGAIVMAVEGGPILFHGFKGPLSSLAVSTVIGLTAGLSCADDAGRRYIVGVAAAVQLAIFPVWTGVAMVGGTANSRIVSNHLLSFAINLATITVTSVAAYALAHGRKPRS